MTSPSNWITVTESNFPWEKEALEYVRQHFPTYEPYRAWSNFEFVASDGSINEVDLLVFTLQGVFLVEIKSRPGRLSGDSGTWFWENDGKSRAYDNPLILANSKAKKLRSLLGSQKAFRGKYKLPFIEALVFCSATDLKCDLKDNARLRICLRDRVATATKPMRSGIISALLKRDCLGLDEPRGIHDRPTSKAFALAMEQAGIRKSQQQRRVSDYLLKTQIGEGQGYQDWQADHVSLPNSIKRVRLYLVHSNWTDAEKKIVERAALREFQILESLQHPGILRTYGYTEHQLGSAIVFDHDPDSMRLDLYLLQHKDILSVDMRLELLRQITEAIAYAHQKRVVHRALCPQSILVVELSRQRRQIKILNWQVGYREDSSTTGGTTAIAATSHVSVLVDDASKAYLAPEALSNISEGEHLDIFSLGAIAYHLFSGQPPASDGVELSNKLRATKGLQISGVIDGVGKELQELIQLSTHPDVSLRIGSTTEFLERLELVEDELTAPSEMEILVEDPNLAQKGDILAGRFEVLHRLGQGGSAIAFLVQRDGQEYVIKVANDPEYNDRLRGEAEILQRLRHESIVEFRGLEMVGDRVAFLMNPVYVDKKSDKRSEKKIETLGQRLRREGQLHLELLGRFGEDLLNAVRYLEDQKVYHRDIKPDNITVGQVGRGDRLHAVLFDFSLSKAPLEQIQAGTIGYLDPLLPLRNPPIWDSYAERYAIAITLYELATGTIPKWGDGISNPSFLECEITIDAELFDLALRDSLPEFFAKALRRDITDRFDNAEQMLREWQECFAAIEPSGATLTEEERLNLQEQLAIATGDTPITELGLDARALQVLDRNNILLVKDLLSVQNAWLISLRGVGSKTKREIADVVKQLRDKELAEAEVHELRSQNVADPSKLSIDTLVQRISRASGKGSPKTKSRWVKDAAIVRLRGDVAEILANVGLVMSLDEAAAAILVARGSYYDEPQRTKYAIAILQIVLEVEAAMAKPRFRLYDNHENLRSPMIAANQEALNYAIAIGQVADRLAESDPLLPPLRAVSQLRTIAAPMAEALTDKRLMQLATVASQQAALSSRQEFYPRGMDAGRALKLSQGALLGVPTLAIAEICDRLDSRYPEAANIPDRPELDQLLAAAGLDLIWDAKGADGWGCYVNRLLSPFLNSSSINSFSRQPTAVGALGEIDEAAADARLFEEKLQRGIKQGSFLVILVQSRYYQQAIAEIANRLPILHLSFEDLLLDALREVADRAKVDWELVLETDARPYEGDWDKLLLLVDRALMLVNEQLAVTNCTVLLSHVGMLARYDRLNWIEHWRDRVGSEIAGLWLLIPSDRPFINGKAIPLMSPSQKTTMPKSWLENRHRAVN